MGMGLDHASIGPFDELLRRLLHDVVLHRLCEL